LGIVCVLALWRGRFDERSAAFCYLVDWLLTRLAYIVSGQAEVVVLGIDTALLGALLWIALRTRRFWPLFSAAFQLLAILTHLARLADTNVSLWAYLTAELVWSYLVIGAIGYGAWTAPRYANADAVAPADTRR
jgi:hypothetical protein